MDHDRLFKELISTFFIEFVDLFLPAVSEYLDKDVTLVPLDKEVFTDVSLREKRLVDLVMKAKFRGQDTFFLIHIENESKDEPDFPMRMFRYFSRLTTKYNLPVYPVVIFSHDAPLRKAPDRFNVVFPDMTVLRFAYRAIQLNRLPWRRFVKKANPVASALMAKMKMSPADRPRVKSECLRLLASLKLDPARSKLIGVFIDSYLELTAQEMEKYRRITARWEPAEREATMELMTSWEKEGLEKGRKEGRHEGRHDGKEELLAIQLEQRFSTLPANITERLDRLTAEELDDLGREIFSFISLSDLEQWLALH